MKIHLTLTISTLILTGCITTPALDAEHRPAEWGKTLHQAHNFHQISDTVYRSEQPDSALSRLMKSQGIDVVINLRSRNKDLEVLSGQGFELKHIPIHTWAISKEDMLEVMQIIQQAKARNQQVLLHCYHGSDRTGASVAMYRIIFEGWSTEEAVREMKQGGYGFHPVWQNIDRLFRPENIKWIREQLANPS